MNKTVTTEQDILRVSRRVVLEEGILAFSMRSVAKACGVAVGSLYNYFPSKSGLLGATIESIWREIFLPFEQHEEFDGFADCVSCMFDTILAGNQKYPGFLNIHSLHFVSSEKEEGRQQMDRYFSRLQERMLAVLKNDPAVRKGAFSTELSMETFTDYSFTLLITILVRQQEDCTELLQMIRNCIY